MGKMDGGIDGCFENCILGPGFKIDLSESEMLGLTRETDAILIGTGGSDRKYFRVKGGNHSTVLMQCPDNDPDFQRHIEYTRFFKKYSVAVPEMLDVNPDKKSASFEDLGDLSLYGWLKCPRDEGQTEEMYRKVIDILITIHTVATEHVSECAYLKDRFFDYEYLRWETGYFIERFVEGIRNIRGRDLSALNNEFHRLAVKVDSFSRTVIHRDFQSQNIMITKGSPRFVDYQGARIGPPAYDVVSILWDPYSRLQDGLRESLLNYYIAQMNRVTLPTPPSVIGTHTPIPPLARGIMGGAGKNYQFVESEFRDTILPCKLQRHMQALGAYGFLSTVKGKKYFLKYVSEGLRLLKNDVSLSKDEYPGLHKLVISIPQPEWTASADNE
jgi:aminoglycoside/choline kinase family phosphotransferase